MFWLLCTQFSRAYNLQNIIYNYSESGHGKGSADGIGGFIKRTADSIVAHGKDVHNYDTLVNVIQEKCKNIFIGKVGEDEINQISTLVPKTIKTFRGTMKVHQWKWNTLYPNLIRFNEMSCYACSVKEKCKHFYLGEIEIQATPSEVVEKRKTQSKQHKTALKKVKK